MLVTIPPPEHPFRQQLEKGEGYVDARLCVLPPAHAYHSPNHPCVVALLAIDVPLEVIICDAGGPTKREKLDPCQLIEIPSYAPYFFTIRSPPTSKAMFCVGYKYLANSHTHERVPPVDAWSQGLAFPYLRKGETVRMITGKEALMYGGAKCVIVSNLQDSDSNNKHEVASCVLWHEDKKAWALAHHANGVLQEKQRDRAAFSLRASRDQLQAAASYCLSDGNELTFVSVFLILAELLAPLGDSELMGKLSQKYASVVTRAMTDTSTSNELREAVMQTQAAIGNRTTAPAPKNINSNSSINSTNQQQESSTDLTCALDSCNKKEDLRRCGACKKVYYCSIEHQKKHWGVHKPQCTK